MVDGSARHDVCRLSDEPQWKIALIERLNFERFDRLKSFLLLDSDGQPIVVTSDEYGYANNIRIDLAVNDQGVIFILDLVLTDFLDVLSLHLWIDPDKSQEKYNLAVTPVA